MPRETIVKDLVEFIRRTAWSNEEMIAIYTAAREKMLSKTCFICQMIKPVFGGELYWPDGDMSKPKKFRCADCRGVL